MVVEEQGSKGGGSYVGGFLHLFDWNAKSRKKLISNKSDIPEQSKQKKGNDGNFSVTRLQVVGMDEDENGAGSSIKGSSDYSCASSVTDEEVYGRKAPGVVARLMGLDSLPKSNFSEATSTPFSDTQSLPDDHDRRKNLEFHQDHQITQSSNLRNKVDPPFRNSIKRPIEKFQAETLPPKSAKLIPITHHKLLSPIKSPSFVPSKNVAHMMEAAAKIIDSEHQSTTTKAKTPSVGSASVPLKVQDLKGKAETSRQPTKLAEASRRPVESNAAKYLKGQSLNKSWNGSVDTKSFRTSSDLEEYSSGLKKKGKSISLALQAKANVQKREGLFGQKEQGEAMSIEMYKSQPNTQRSSHKKPPTCNSSSSVLRQNNQKQNCVANRGKLPSKVLSRDSSFGQQKTASKILVNPKGLSRKSGFEVRGSKMEVPYSSKKNVISKKRALVKDFEFEKNQVGDIIGENVKAIQSYALLSRRFGQGEDNKRKGMDVISFTFTAPMTKSILGPETTKNSGFRSNSSDGTNGSKLSTLGYNVIGGEALGALLEQKLRELTHGVESSRLNAGTTGTSASIFQGLMIHDKRSQDGTHTDNIGRHCGSGYSSTDPQGLMGKLKPQGADEMDECGSNDSETRKLLNCRHASPISVLEPSYFTESCNSSDTADSNGSEGSKQCSSAQAQTVSGTTSSKKYHFMEADTELLDSASSTSTKTRKHADSTIWELEYVKEILYNVELMFKDFASGGTREIINPRLFDQLETRKVVSDSHGAETKQRRKVIFDCVTECVDLRCRVWAKGILVVRRKDWLAKEVYKEISKYKSLEDCMVDELLDGDMSSQHGRWVDFEIEAFEVGVEIEGWILDSLINEAVADMLLV